MGSAVDDFSGVVVTEPPELALKISLPAVQISGSRPASISTRALSERMRSLTSDSSRRNTSARSIGFPAKV